MGTNLESLTTMKSSKPPHRIIDQYCNLHYVIGMLHGYVCGLNMAETSIGVNLEALRIGLMDCTEMLDKVAHTFREEYGNN